VAPFDTLSFSHHFFHFADDFVALGINADGGEKDQKNESDNKTEVELDLAEC